MINKRRKFKNAIDEEGKKEYSNLRIEFIRRSKKEKEDYLNEIYEEINRKPRVDNVDKVYGTIKKFLGERKEKATVVKDNFYMKKRK